MLDVLEVETWREEEAGVAVDDDGSEEGEGWEAQVRFLTHGLELA